jgi:L-ascorbate metabolism protein UlaG (beta-lactamase superfamily)
VISQNTEANDPANAVRISWMGHAMFILEDKGGNRLVTDPYNEYVGYNLPDIEADIVLVSHDHGDHSNIDLVKGNPIIKRDTGAQEIKGILITGFSSHHDSYKGKERGPNVIFRWEMQGLVFIHLGDLGHVIEGELAEELSGADVLFIPVGGVFTIEDSQAEQVVKKLKPHIAVPMHYRTPACSLPLQTEEPFVARFDNVERTGKQPLLISKENLPEKVRILVMDYLS